MPDDLFPITAAVCCETVAAALAGLYCDAGPDLSALPQELAGLFRLCPEAFDAVIHARASGLPPEAAAERFRRRVMAAADAAGRAANSGAAADAGRERAAMRRAAAVAAGDADDPDAREVYGAADKVRHEIARLRGFLRFAPGGDGVYVARCAPDHFVLPALGGYFRKRFGGAPWGIIDEKRGIRLSYVPGGVPRLLPAGAGAAKPAAGDGWEELWRGYLGAVSNGDRQNRSLQAKFMPRRYREYLTEGE